ncbi:hypothetical protein [Armatimonas sp.]|uniref:hypothetical protein n=1 Tax=Armatimonas sp. TaxID=1872638 RepID=UPI003752EBF4
MKTRVVMERINKRVWRASSLVEVLVVLVILLIGVFSVVRIFPIGFTYLRNNESRMRSTRLAHALMEKVQNEAANLPEALCYSYFTGVSGSLVRQFVLDEDPDDLSGDPANPYYKDVNKFRFVVGEPVKIGLPTPTAMATGSIYIAKFGPIYMDRAITLDPAYPQTAAEQNYSKLFLAVNSAPLNVTYGFKQADPNLYRGRLTGPQNCVIDTNEDENGGAWILFYPSARNRTFKIRYSKLVNDHDDNDVNPLDDVVAMTVERTVPANAFTWLPIPGVLSDDTIQTGSEVVTREFDRLPLTGPTKDWDPEDPYQFKIISSNIDAASTTSVANLGIVAFNPAGARFVNNGQDPFKAYLDYAALDWHIIHDDRDVPAVIPGADGEVPFRTTLTRLKSLDYINPDNTFYEGIFPGGDTNPLLNTDILIVRLDTGGILNQAQNGRPGDYGLLKAGDPANSAANQDYWANTDPKTGSYSTGTFYINNSKVPAGTPIRIFYKAQGEWAVSLNKAMATYRETNASWLATLTNVSLDASDPAQDRFVDASLPDKFWRATAGGVGALYFARTELNKSVVATLQARATPTSPWKRTQPLQIVVDTPDTVTAGANTVRVSYADVSKHLKRLGWDGAHDNWRVVTNIKGVSAKSRVIWKDSLEKNSPWRIQDLDTYLTQGTLQ